MSGAAEFDLVIPVSVRGDPAVGPNGPYCIDYGIVCGTPNGPYGPMFCPWCPHDPERRAVRRAAHDPVAAIMEQRAAIMERRRRAALPWWRRWGCR